LRKGRCGAVVLYEHRVQTVAADQFGFYRRESEAIVECAARELYLRGNRSRRVQHPQLDLPALCGLRLFGRRVFCYLQLLRAQRLSERDGIEHRVDIGAQRAGCHGADVEVHVLRIADAAMEEAQVAAAFERK
jgi:hypothetical protein